VEEHEEEQLDRMEGGVAKYICRECMSRCGEEGKICRQGACRCWFFWLGFEVEAGA
jgi:hypothetical protein